MASAPHNHVLNHIAYSVPDVDAAVKWYSEVFGLKKLNSGNLLGRDIDENGIINRIYGARLRKVKIAYMSMGNGVGIEFFEFIDPAYKAPEKEFEYERGGVFHICMTVTNIDESKKRVLEHGGKLIGEPIGVVGEEKAFYCLDPWGNCIECLTISFERLMSGRP